MRDLVLSASPAARAVKPPGEIAADVKGKPSRVGATLEELAVRHVVQSVDGEAEPRWELVHDVLCEACARATTPSAMGLGVLRSALRRGRRWLSLRDYWRALHADFGELPEVPRKRARRLLRLTEAFIGMRALLLALLVLLGIQFSFAHVRIESHHPNAIRVYRGLRILGGLPAPLGRVVLFDTGLTDEDVHASRRNELLELSLRAWDGALSERTRRLNAWARRLCALGHWDDCTRIVLYQGSTMSSELHTEQLRRLAAFAEFEPRLLESLSAASPRWARIGAISALGEIELSNAEEVVPQLLAWVDDRDANVRCALAETLGRIGGTDTEKVVPQLLTWLDDSSPKVRIAAAQALAQLEAADAVTLMPRLLTSLRGDDAALRIAAASAVEQVAAADAAAVVPQLLALLEDETPDVRVDAVELLGRIGTADAAVVVPRLLTLAYDPHPSLRSDPVLAPGGTASGSATTGPSDERPWSENARQEHDALTAELEHLRGLQRPWWLRLAAWDVFLGPYDP